MDLVSPGVAKSYEERRQSPGPAPSNPAATNATVQEQAEDKVFGKVGGLANVMVNDFELMSGDRRLEPADDVLEERRGVSCGERVGGHGEDDGGPEKSGPPGAQPCGE